MDTRHTGIIDHASADAYLGRRADRALPGRASRLERRGDDIAVLFHGTAVVTYHPDGSVTLDSGGWLTSTTKQRINAYTRAPVYSVKGKWLVGVPGGGKVPFRDGIRVDAEGRTAGKGRKAKRDAALRAAIPARPEFKPILRRLRVEAEAGVRARGHELGRWFQLSPRSMEATCKLCGRGVTINARPAPNGIDIGGSACGLNCHMVSGGGKKRAPTFGLMVEPRPYQCTACGHKQTLSTNHTDNAFDFCHGCSWKVGAHPGIDVGGRRYRAFKYIGRGKLTPNPHARGGKARAAGGRQWWNVYLNGKLIDSMEYPASDDADDVKRSLVGHDGYDPGIVVRRHVKPRKSREQRERAAQGRAWYKKMYASGPGGGKRRADVGGLAASILQLTR